MSQERSSHGLLALHWIFERFAAIRQATAHYEQKHHDKKEKVYVGFWSTVSLCLFIQIFLLEHQIMHERLNRAFIGAILNGDTLLARRLLDAGADPNTVMEPSKTRTIWQWLIQCFPHEQRQTTGTNTALIAVVGPRWTKNGVRAYLFPPTENIDMVNALLKKGARVNARGRLNTTPLIWAVAYKQHKVMALLLRHGAMVDVSNAFGKTALMFASMNNDPNSVELLLKNGASVDLCDNTGRTALMWAIIQNPHNCQKVMNILMK